MVEMGGSGGGEVAAGGEPDDADAFRVAAPVLGLRSRPAKGALGIEERDRVVAGGHPILQHHAGDVMSVQPAGNAVAFGLFGESSVTSARADDDDGAVGAVRMVHRQKRGSFGSGTRADRRRFGPQRKTGAGLSGREMGDEEQEEK
jgi:hypothetical protein